MANATMEAVQEINLGSVEKVPLGQGFCFVVGGEQVAVFRQRDGRLFATQNKCPHRQGPLSEGIVGNGTVICPLHAHRFDLQTGHCNDAHECVRTFAVRDVNGEMLLRLPEQKTREVAAAAG